MKFKFPLKGAFYYTCEFGDRRNPITGKKQFHTGIDIAAPFYRRKIYIRSVEDGIVIESKRGTGYGNFILIKHRNGFVTRYAHLKKRFVRKYRKVKKGSKIGIMGTTGRSTGRHLHFEVLYKKKLYNPQLIF